MSWFKKHKILTVILGLIVLGIIASAAGGGSKKNDSNTQTSNKSTNQSSAPTIAKIGEAARDGKFEFTVSKISCGETSVGTNQYLTKQAQGKQYSADDTATLYAAPQGASSTWFSDINPGNSVSGDIIFDIPKDVTPTTAELHDSAFSSGVKVNLQ